MPNCPHCHLTIDTGARFCSHCGKTLVSGAGDIIKSPKSAVITLLLCFFLGFLGLHRFYVGKTRTGLLQLFGLPLVFLLSVIGVVNMVGGLLLGLAVLIWPSIDFFIIACSKFQDSEGRIVAFADPNQSARVNLIAGLVVILLAVGLVYYWATHTDITTGLSKEQYEYLQKNLGVSGV